MHFIVKYTNVIESLHVIKCNLRSMINTLLKITVHVATVNLYNYRKIRRCSINLVADLNRNCSFLFGSF